MTTFFVSDTHFGHENFLKFRDANGFLIRGFESVEDMNELMIERWNAIVRPADLVWHLGDVVWNPETAKAVLPRLNGTKRLILGNHDNVKKQNLMSYFQDVQMWRNFSTEGFMCSHVPLRDETIRGDVLNVHGHIHQLPAPTERHLNICVEMTGYSPVSMDFIEDVIKSRR